MNDDQLVEIEATQAIFGDEFRAGDAPNTFSLALLPCMDSDEVNHGEDSWREEKSRAIYGNCSLCAAGRAALLPKQASAPARPCLLAPFFILSFPLLLALALFHVQSLSTYL